MAMAKKVLGALTEPNTIANGGGLSSLLVPVKANPLGVGLVVGGMTAVSVLKEGTKFHNQASLGKVHYQGTAARMTSNYEKYGAGKMTSGAGQAIHRAITNGNTELAYEMTEQTMKSPGVAGAIESYGVTPQFVSAIYGMGG